MSTLPRKQQGNLIKPQSYLANLKLKQKQLNQPFVEQSYKNKQIVLLLTA